MDILFASKNWQYQQINEKIFEGYDCVWLYNICENNFIQSNFVSDKTAIMQRI